MVDSARAGGFLRKAAERARQAADALRDEYRKGKEGDESPVVPIAPSAIDVIKVWMAKSDDHAGDESVGGESVDASINDLSADDAPSEQDDARAVSQVAALLGDVNWNRVSDAVRDNAATQRMRDLASQVDWAAAKPVAARVASVLIAAAAAGELGGLQGATGRYVARTIANEMGLAEKVAQRINSQRTEQNRPMVDYIETTASEAMASGTGADAGGFESRLLELGQLGAGSPNGIGTNETTTEQTEH